MSNQKKERYFVVGLTEQDHRPVPEAEFEIQILNDIGQGERIAFYSYSSDAALALLDANIGAIEVVQDPVPKAIVEMCRQRSNWPGYYMDEDGEIVLPAFFEPTKAMLETEREKIRRRNQ